MIGQHSRSESLFYYVRIEDQVPENHLLRLIDRHVSFQFVRDELRDSYSGTARLRSAVRILLLGYLYGITSERKFAGRVAYAPGWQWFTGLGCDQEMPHHAMFFQESA